MIRPTVFTVNEKTPIEAKIRLYGDGSFTIMFHDQKLNPKPIPWEGRYKGEGFNSQEEAAMAFYDSLTRIWGAGVNQGIIDSCKVVNALLESMKEKNNHGI